eukprot:gene5880-9708_t
MKPSTRTSCFLFIVSISCIIFLGSHFLLFRRLTRHKPRYYLKHENFEYKKDHMHDDLLIISNANELYMKLEGKENLKKYSKTGDLSSQTTVITQLSEDRFSRLLSLVERWKEEISVCLYVKYKIEPYLYVENLYKKNPILFQDRIRLHLVFNKTKMEYPLNRLRNIAWEHSYTKFVFLLDVDFIPNSEIHHGLDQLHTKSPELLKQLENNEIVFVLPTFNYLCRDNTRIETCWTSNEILGVHHQATKPKRWYHSTKPYQVKYELFYEPYIIGHRNMPRYDDRFTIGNDKVSHIYELAAAKYQFWVLTIGYIGHVPHDKDIIWSLDQKDYNNTAAWLKFLDFTKYVYLKYNYFKLCGDHVYHYSIPLLGEHWTNPSDPLPRNMVVYKINNKELLLHSVIAMKEEDMKQLESIGIPKIIIVPNSFHNMDYPLYQERYKDIIVTTPSFYAKSLKNVDSSIEDWLNKNEEMKQKIIIHNPTEGQFEYLYEFRMDENSAAAVLCDQMFNLKKTGGFAGFIQYQMGSSGFFGVSFIGRMLLKCMGKTKMFKDWFSNIKEKIPCLKLICVAHGGVVSENLDDKIKIASDML